MNEDDIKLLKFTVEGSKKYMPLAEIEEFVTEVLKKTGDSMSAMAFQQLTNSVAKSSVRDLVETFVYFGNQHMRAHAKVRLLKEAGKEIPDDVAKEFAVGAVGVTATFGELKSRYEKLTKEETE